MREGGRKGGEKGGREGWTERWTKGGGGSDRGARARWGLAVIYIYIYILYIYIISKYSRLGWSHQPTRIAASSHRPGAAATHRGGRRGGWSASGLRRDEDAEAVCV